MATGRNIERLLERLDELFVEVRGDYHAAKYVSKEGRRLIREFLANREDAVRVKVEWNGPLGHGEIWADDDGRYALIDLESADAANARALREAWTWQPANTEGEREEGDDG